MSDISASDDWVHTLRPVCEQGRNSRNWFRVISISTESPYKKYIITICPLALCLNVRYFGLGRFGPEVSACLWTRPKQSKFYRVISDGSAPISTKCLYGKRFDNNESHAVNHEKLLGLPVLNIEGSDAFNSVFDTNESHCKFETPPIQSTVAIHEEMYFRGSSGLSCTNPIMMLLKRNIFSTTSNWLISEIFTSKSCGMLFSIR